MPSTHKYGKCGSARTLFLGVTGLVLGLSLSLSGCGKSTYLVLDFVDSASPSVYGIRVGLKLSSSGSGSARESIGTLPSANNTALITLPTSAAFKLDNESGSVDITAELLDSKKEAFAKQTATTTIRHAQTWRVSLDFGKQAFVETAPLEIDLGSADITADVGLDETAASPVWTAAP